MREAASDEPWASGRALCEGATPTHALIGACMGVDVAIVSRRATQEGWNGLDVHRPRVAAAHRRLVEFVQPATAVGRLNPLVGGRLSGEGAVEGAETSQPLDDVDPRQRLARIGEMLTRRTEALLRDAEAGHTLDTKQVSALGAMVQLAERIEVLARENAARVQIKRNEQLAEVLDKIHKRICYLACQMSRRILTDVGVSGEVIEAAVGAYEAFIGDDPRVRDIEEEEESDEVADKSVEQR